MSESSSAAAASFYHLGSLHACAASTTSASVEAGQYSLPPWLVRLQMHHLQIMESLGGDSLWLDRFMAQHGAIVYYWVGNRRFLCFGLRDKSSNHTALSCPPYTAEGVASTSTSKQLLSALPVLAARSSSPSSSSFPRCANFPAERGRTDRAALLSLQTRAEGHVT